IKTERLEVDPSKAARNKSSSYGEVAVEQTNHIRSSVKGCSRKATLTHKLTKYPHQSSGTHQTQKGAVGGGSLDLTIISREVTRCVLHPTTRIDGGLASCRLRTGSACGAREPRTRLIHTTPGQRLIEFRFQLSVNCQTSHRCVPFQTHSSPL